MRFKCPLNDSFVSTAYASAKSRRTEDAEARGTKMVPSRLNDATAVTTVV
jgi:hypothetical protein